MFDVTKALKAPLSRSIRASVLFAALALLFVFTALSVNAQTTSFTYQGHLTEAINSPSGPYDFQFAVFDLAGNQQGPLQTVSGVSVANGVFTVSLDFGSAPFAAGADVFLEIRVKKPSDTAYTTLTPRQRITSVPYAIRTLSAAAADTATSTTAFTGSLSGDVNGTQNATVVSSVGGASAGNVANAAAAVFQSTPSNTPNALVKRDASGNFTAGTITANLNGSANGLAPGVALANLNASGQTGVPIGGMIVSFSANDSALTGAGYVLTGQFTTGGWRDGTPSSIPGRANYSAVWTGSEMIVFGGQGASGAMNDGARYNPTTNIWTTLPTTGAPSARAGHSAVWTGTEMIIFGGGLNDGARYNLTTNTWTALPTSGAPSARSNYTAVWTGSEMIIFGGHMPSLTPLGDGARYNPTTNTWTAMSTVGAPSPRYDYSAVWTGSDMIVFGGHINQNITAGVFGDGARYTPTTDGWTTLPSTGAPAPRASHSAVWSGSEMIVFGGYTLNGSGFLVPYNDGALYKPTTNTWTALPATGAPSPRYNHIAVWTGSAMVVFGGQGASNNNLTDGALYRPSSNAWTGAIPTSGPSPRSGYTAVWSGSELLTYGGTVSNFSTFPPVTTYYQDTHALSPGSTIYLYQHP